MSGTSLRIRVWIILILAAGVPACDVDRRTANVRPATPRERNLVEVRWHRVWTAGGAEGDTTLLQPWRLAVGAEHVYVADKAGYRIAAFAIGDGRLAWIRGREGSGPGEYRLPTALGVDRDEILWVADARNQRLTLYRADGGLHRSIDVPDLSYVEGLCPTAAGVTAATSAVADPIVQLSSRGEVLRRSPLPWPDLAGAPPLAVQKLLASSGENCVLALVLGRGFATVGGTRSRTYPYLDPAQLPAVEKTLENGGSTVSERVVDMRIAATSVAAVGDEVAISPGGSGPLENRLIDFYGAADGAYRMSYTTPVPFQQMARSGDLFFFLTHRDGYPALIAVRPERVG